MHAESISNWTEDAGQAGMRLILRRVSPALVLEGPPASAFGVVGVPGVAATASYVLVTKKQIQTKQKTNMEVAAECR